MDARARMLLDLGALVHAMADGVSSVAGTVRGVFHDRELLCRVQDEAPRTVVELAIPRLPLVLEIAPRMDLTLPLGTMLDFEQAFTVHAVPHELGTELLDARTRELLLGQHPVSVRAGAPGWLRVERVDYVQERGAQAQLLRFAVELAARVQAVFREVAEEVRLDGVFGDGPYRK